MTTFEQDQRVVIGHVPNYPELAGLTGVVVETGEQGWRGKGGWVRLDTPPDEMAQSTARSTRPNCMWLYASECEPATAEATRG